MDVTAADAKAYTLEAEDALLQTHSLISKLMNEMGNHPPPSVLAQLTRINKGLSQVEDALFRQKAKQPAHTNTTLESNLVHWLGQYPIVLLELEKALEI